MEMENFYNTEWSKLNSLLSLHLCSLLYLALLHSAVQVPLPYIDPCDYPGKILHIRADSLHSTSTL